MSDNVDVTPGTGATVATDIIAGAHHQRVKISLGANGTAADAPGEGTFGMDVDVTRLPALPAGTNNIGDVDVLTVPVDPFGTNADAAAGVGLSGSIQSKLRLMTSQLDAIQTAVQLIDNAIAGTEMQVDIVSGTLALSGEAHVGEVGGSTLVYTPTVTVTAGAYSAGDVVGGRITLTNAMRVSGGSGYLTDLILTTADGEAMVATILIFDSTTASSIADNAAFAWGAGDHAKLLALIPVAAADYTTLDSDGVVHLKNLNIAVEAAGSQNLYAYIICTATPTFAATTDVGIRFKFMQD